MTRKEQIAQFASFMAHLYTHGHNILVFFREKDPDYVPRKFPTKRRPKRTNAVPRVVKPTGGFGKLPKKFR